LQNSIDDKEKIETFGFYENRNAYVFGKLETDDKSIASYLYTMRHVYRENFKDYGVNVKCFVDLRNVEAVENHFPVKCLGRDGYHNCPGHDVNTNQSYLMHFRVEHDYPEDCDKEDKRECAVYDTVMWKYYKVLDKNMKYALKKIFNR
jgi:hypothetical protein